MSTDIKLKKIKVKLVRGRAKASKKQALVLDSLGLKKTNSEVEKFNSDTILGMIKKVSHLVNVSDA